MSVALLQAALAHAHVVQQDVRLLRERRTCCQSAALAIRRSSLGSWVRSSSEESRWAQAQRTCTHTGMGPATGTRTAEMLLGGLLVCHMVLGAAGMPGSWTAVDRSGMGPRATR